MTRARLLRLRGEPPAEVWATWSDCLGNVQALSGHGARPPWVLEHALAIHTHLLINCLKADEFLDGVDDVAPYHLLLNPLWLVGLQEVLDCLSMLTLTSSAASTASSAGTLEKKAAAMATTNDITAITPCQF